MLKKNVILGLLLLATVASPSIEKNSLISPQYVIAIAEDGIDKVQLIMKKLRASMASMKDLDELEKAGMSKKNVDRMRRAMTHKTDQMINEAVDLIHAL